MPSRESRGERTWMRDPFLFTLALTSLAFVTVVLAVLSARAGRGRRPAERPSSPPLTLWERGAEAVEANGLVDALEPGQHQLRPDVRGGQHGLAVRRLADLGRGRYLAAARLVLDPGRDVDGGPEVVQPLVGGHGDARPLVDAAPDQAGSVRVADGLDDGAVVGRDRLPEQRELVLHDPECPGLTDLLI